MPARKHIVRPSYIQAPADQLLFDFESKDVKQCQRCGQWLPLDSFYRMAKGRMGRQADCKRCRVDRYGKPGQMERLARKEQGLKVCLGCNRELPVEAFGWTGRNRSVVRHRCRECRNAEHRAAYAADPESFRAKERTRYYRNHDTNRERFRLYYLKYREANREKMREKSRQQYRRHAEWYKQYAKQREIRKRGVAVVPFTFDQLRQKFAFWGDRCWMCGGEAETMDHVKPICKGGLHVLSNIRPACRSCNSRKSGTWPLPPSQLLKQYS